MFAEIGHFYIDQEFKPGCFDYLKNLKLSNYYCSIFIDDYNVGSNHALDIPALILEAKNVIGVEPDVFYESKMVDFFWRAVGAITEVPIKTETTDLGVFLSAGKRRLGQIYPILQPTCFMLSLTWTLFRLGFFKWERNNVLTIIDKKYKKMELEICNLLPKSFQSHLYYRFF